MDTGEGGSPPHQYALNLGASAASPLFVAESMVPGVRVVDACTDSGDDAVVAQALKILRGRLARPGRPMTTPDEVRDFARLHLAHLEYEVFAVMFLDAQHGLIEFRHMFFGTLTMTSVYPREVAKAALILNAAGVILLHNHPSQSGEVSRADELLTIEICEGLRLFGIRVVDHLVVAGEEVVSFVTRGIL
jgi:DNA repair protein RadC